MQKIYYPEKLNDYIEAHWPGEIRPGPRLRRYNDSDGLGMYLYAEEWPSDLNGGLPPTVEEVDGWDPAPVTDVEIATGNFKAARIAAPEYLDGLKGTVWAALKAGGMSPSEATAAGVALVLLHAAPLAAFESAGGHPDAGLALYTAIASQESVAALPWLTAPILAIFAAALAPGQ